MPIVYQLFEAYKILMVKLGPKSKKFQYRFPKKKGDQFNGNHHFVCPMLSYALFELLAVINAILVIISLEFDLNNK